MDEEVSSEMSDPSLVQKPSEQHGMNNEAEATMTKPSSSKKNLLVRILRWYVRFSASAANQDKLLKLLQWSLTLLKGQAWPQKVALEISFARYVTRLLGWPSAVEAAVNDSWCVATNNEIWHKWVGRILAHSMVLYYPAEHLAYALWMKPNTANQNDKRILSWTAEKWSYVSCRFWLAYIVAEMAQSMFLLKETPPCTNSKLQLTRNALFLLPCINWARSDWDSKPWLKTETVNRIMWAEAIVSMYQAWRNTSEDF